MYKIFVLHVKHFSEIVQIESYVASKSNVHLSDRPSRLLDYHIFTLLRSCAAFQATRHSEISDLQLEKVGWDSWGSPTDAARLIHS